MSMSAFTGARQALSWLIVSPVVENIRSSGVEDAKASINTGKVKQDGEGPFPLLAHQGLVEVSSAGRPL